MNLQQAGAVVVITGVVMFVLAMFTSPPGLYTELDIDRRVAMLTETPTRWIVSQGLFGLGVLVPALGFGLLAAQMWGGPGGWPAAIGAALLIAGGVVAVYWVYVQTLDPGSFWRMPEVTVPGLALAALNIAGRLFLGVAFWQSPLPYWTGWLTVGYGILFAAVALALRGGGGFWLLTGMYGVALVDAIAFLRG
jgi:hypothetical protein